MILALELMDQCKVKASEVLGFSCAKHTRQQCNIHVTSEALVLIYHHFRVPPKFVSADVVDEYAHIHVPVRGCIFTGLVKVEDSGQFLASKQRALPGRGAKRIASETGSDTHRDLPGQKRLAFAGGDHAAE
jgi:hypothetical protein